MIHRLDIYNTMIETGLIPIFNMENLDDAISYVDACIRGGVRVMEFTNRGDHSLPVFRAVRQAFPEMIFGIGSIVDAPSAALYVANGANFIVGPNFNLPTALFCNTRKIAYLPGCATLTEIHVAEQYGVEIVKLFPSDVLGHSFVKSLLGPSPWTRIMPTGGIGIDRDNIRQWFDAGVSCVGIGSALMDVDNVSLTCQQILKWIQEF